MQINLSEHSKLKILELNEQIIFSLYDLMIARISKVHLEDLIKKSLEIPRTKVSFSKKNENFIIEIKSPPNPPPKEIIIEKILDILSVYLPSLLKHKYTNRPIFYITKNSRIPLLGSLYFGIIDRGTNLIQVRPMTGCILNCPFCSVNEGPRSENRHVDYIVDAAYLMEEVKKVIAYKDISDIEIHIDGQCEPTLYPSLPLIISEFAKDPRISVISMQTNGIPLTPTYIKILEKAGLNRINLSINSLNQKMGRYLAGIPEYDTNHIQQIAHLIAKSSIQLLVAPLWIPGLNDNDIEDIISFVSRLHQNPDTPPLGIQNYLKYKLGRKVKGVKQVNMKKFTEKLYEWEKKFQISPLVLSQHDFGMHSAKRCPKIFRKGEKIQTEIILPGRLISQYGDRREMLGTAKSRIVHIINSSSKLGDFVFVKITHVKDNIYYGTEFSI
ncbi:MAG: radical SAM protein [Candidatus Helarchaeota archaeon]